eukprot:5460791-Pyramimonas_sp.AAC.1
MSASFERPCARWVGMGAIPVEINRADHTRPSAARARRNPSRTFTADAMTLSSVPPLALSSPSSSSPPASLLPSSRLSLPTPPWLRTRSRHQLARTCPSPAPRKRRVGNRPAVDATAATTVAPD